MDKTVAFARNVKEELLKKEYTGEEKRMILSGFLLNCAKISSSSPYLTIKSEIANCIQFFYKVLKDEYGIEGYIHFKKNSNLKKSMYYYLSIKEEKIFDILSKEDIFSQGEMKVSSSLKGKRFKFYLIGLFLSSGSVNNPYSNKTSYFLEISFVKKDDVSVILKKLNSFKNEKTMNFKMIQRRGRYIIYLKKSDQISVFLSYIGATTCMFEFENARIERDDINTINRLTICDLSNMKKSLKVAKEDIKLIDTLLSIKPMSLFDDKTQYVIKTRKDNPEMNFREIASYICENYNVQITKSGVVHILTSLRKQASDYIKKLQDDNS
ncbi:MAG: DNA-binding protein WhiA [Candidatus Enterosoma sp.]|nr:DNA-binding protein WhiA [Bacilli bacterium]MDD7607897.1 DNA-binding protein WhiA [bacterium]MDY5650064.1 DNA-binding protein WhiA [Candidatus Enterosoma sp.]MDY5865730.1 DNA-binding protein WhiA [Candidatus Enterosoma sp.]